MEYETFFTTVGGLWPAEASAVEFVTVHEFGHGYFMGLLASNEFEEPFLDEGLNEFWDARVLEKHPVRFGLARPAAVFLGHRAQRHAPLPGRPHLEQLVEQGLAGELRRRLFAHRARVSRSRNARRRGGHRERLSRVLPPLALSTSIHGRSGRDARRRRGRQGAARASLVRRAGLFERAHRRSRRAPRDLGRSAAGGPDDAQRSARRGGPGRGHAALGRGARGVQEVAPGPKQAASPSAFVARPGAPLRGARAAVGAGRRSRTARRDLALGAGRAVASLGSAAAVPGRRPSSSIPTAPGSWIWTSSTTAARASTRLAAAPLDARGRGLALLALSFVEAL